MSFDFHETVTLEMPNLGDRLVEFVESEGGKKALIVEVSAIHEGMTANYNFYGADALAEAVNSWVSPYPKPIIMNHDMTSEPIGRVMAAKMDQEADGTPFTRLQVAITDPSAIEKITDKRYLTGSVGGKADEALCSVCNTNWAQASAFKVPCKHVRGKKYKVDGEERTAHIKMNKISFKEYSVVNAPADSRSSFIPSGVGVVEDGAEESDGWIRPARVFALNLDKEEIVEYTESENRNVLSGMKKKDASPLYLGIKGAFLSALAVHESEEDVVEDEDILAVSEGLSADLSVVEEEGAAVDEAAAGHIHSHMHEDGVHAHIHTHDGGEFAYGHGDGSPHGHGHSEDHPDRVLDGPVAPGQTATGDPSASAPSDMVPASPRAADDEEEIVSEEEGVEEEAEEAVQPQTSSGDDPSYNRDLTGRPEGQEKHRAKDISPLNSAGAPINRQSEDGADNLGESEVEEETDTMELNETLSALELRIEELQTQHNTLSEENARLKGALKRSLVERVVDTKIALGMVERDGRDAELSEHMTRTAASLADSLRDLAGMKPIAVDYNDVPRIGETGAAIPVDHNKDGAEPVFTAMTSELEASVKSKKLDPERFFTEVLMGKRKI